MKDIVHVRLDYQARQIVRRLLTCVAVFAAFVPVSEASVAAPQRSPVRVAITIDDLPWSGSLPANESANEALRRIAAVLRVHEAPATGFVICDNAVLDERAIRSWVDWGFEVGNHSAAHRDLNRTPLEVWLKGVSQCQDYLERFDDANSRYFRFPMLHQGQDPNTRSAVSAALTGLGLETAHVSVDTSEWILARAYATALAAGDGGTRHAIGREFVRHVVAAIEHASGVAERKLGRDVPQILLLHANSLLAEHLDDLLLALRSRGVEFITLDEALADPVYERRDDYVGPKGLSWLYRMQPGSPEDAAWDDAEAETIRELFSDTLRDADAAAAPESGSRIVRQSVTPGAPPGLTHAIDQASQSERMRSLLVMHRGRLIAEAYFNGAGPGTAANLKSVTKTVVSALVGVGLQQGWIESLDDPIARYLPERFAEERSSPQAAITLRQLLTMSSGLVPVDYGAIQQSRDWVATLLAQPVRHSESAAFAYDTPVLQLLAAVLRHASGRSLQTLANRELFGPLDAEIVYWRRDSQGLGLGGNDAYMRPRDLIKLGELYRTGGMHDGRAILGASFVRASTTGQIRPDEPTINHGTLPVRGYGFLWWILDSEFDGAYAALGHGGQVLLVSPRRELVVLMTSRWPSASSTEHYRHLARLLREDILPLFPVNTSR